MEKLYNTFVLPHINYCNAVWGSTYATNLKPVYILQKKALKCALGYSRYTISNTVFNDSGMLKLENINKVQIAIFMCKINHGLLPDASNYNFTLVNQIHQYNTRKSKWYHVSKLNTTKYKFSISYRGPKVYNELPHNIKNVQSLGQAKSLLKNYYKSLQIMENSNINK